MPKDAIEYLRHINDECSYILSVSNLTYYEFLDDETLKRAVVRSLEIIGEATKKLPEDFRQKHTNVNWKNMAGMRDKLIHDYIGIDYAIVWDVMQNKIPELSKGIKNIVAEG